MTASTLRGRERRTTHQSIDAAQHPDALLRIDTVAQLIGLAPSSIYRLVAAGELTPIKRGLRCTRFRAADVTAWLRQQGGRQ